MVEDANTQVLILPDSQIVESMIHSIRGMQVMLDFDLACLYGIETKRLKEQVRRNRNRFPSDIMFELTDEEFESLRSQFATSNKRGGLRYHPFAFTETGVAMLSSVLNSEQAIQVNLQIMRAFVSMRRFMVANAQVFQRIEALEFKQIENGKKIDEIFSKLDSGELKPKLGVFFEGQMFDAFLLVENLIKRATKRLVLVDDYVDASVLERFSLRNEKVSVDIYVHSQKQTVALLHAFETYNRQYFNAQLTLHSFNKSHDRWLIVDDEIYHFGASIKDLGKKWFAVNLMTEMTADEFIAKL